MSSTSLFGDELARKTIATQFDTELFVEAGAGSGKTHALVSRVVGLITSGTTTLDRIVVITFTEAAADELRDRIRSSLRGVVVSDADSGAADLARAALSSFSGARISTIHSFCQDILKQSGVFGENATVLDPAEETRLLHSFAIEALTEKWAEQEARSTELLTLLNILGVRTKHWLTLIDQLHAARHKIRSNSFEPSLDFVPQFKVVITQAETLLESMNACVSESDTLVSYATSNVERWLKVARQVDSNAAVLRLLLDAPSTRRQLGSKNNWPIGTLEIARKALLGFNEAVQQERQTIYAQVLNWLLNQGSEVIADFVEYRETRGLFGFHDLLVRADEMLRGSSLRATVADNISYILVDEFQDTDPLQWSIVDQLCAAIRSSGASPFFAVGDPKQSIYRFRGADLQTFLNVRNEMSDNVLALDTSFRSTQLLVDRTNQIGRSLFAAHDLAAHLHAVRDDVAATGYDLIDQDADAEILMDEVREIESELVARQIKNVAEKNTIKYGDIAILIPTRAALPALEAALEDAAIPFRIESPILMWNTQEIVDLLNILRACVDSSDEVALVGALRSIYLGCSDRDLLEYRQLGLAWNHEKTKGATSTVVGEALRQLHELSTAIQFQSPDVALATIMRQFDVNALADVAADPESVRNRLAFLIHSARNYSSRNQVSSLSFCDWASAQREDRAMAYEYPLRASGSNAVRVMTIHAAKGLEFPAVFVCGLNTQAAPPGSVRLLWHGNQAELRVGSKANGIQTNGFADCEELDKQMGIEESARLLYVAMTRARDYLAISTVRRSGSRCLATEWVDVLRPA